MILHSKCIHEEIGKEKRTNIRTVDDIERSISMKFTDCFNRKVEANER